MNKLYPNLRITEWTPNTEETTIKQIDFTLFLTKESPVYNKGRKTESRYIDKDGNLVARKVFTDVLNPDGSLKGLNILIEWYGYNNIVGLSKLTFKPMNIAEVEHLKRGRRMKAIDYLKAAGKGTPIEPYMDAVFTHYEDLIRHWYDMGDLGLKNAIEGETDPTILAYLAIETQPAWTVKDGILYQIDQ